jgi:hypothetical protein
MDLAQAALIFATQLTDRTTNYKYDHVVMAEAVAAIVETTQDVQEVATLISIGRWESGGWRKDIASCRIKGDSNSAAGIFQIHPFRGARFEEEKRKTCSSNYREQVQIALFHVRDSVAVCKMHGYRGASLITVYTHGVCRSADSTARSHWSDGRALEKIIYTETNIVLSKKGETVLASYDLAKE